MCDGGPDFVVKHFDTVVFKPLHLPTEARGLRIGLPSGFGLRRDGLEAVRALVPGAQHSSPAADSVARALSAQSMKADPARVWRIPPDADLHHRAWDGEHVFFHGAAGDTYRLSGAASAVLLRLMRAPADEAALARELFPADEAPPRRSSWNY
jgi:hypothetical protein